jgi:hypothetical protein
MEGYFLYDEETGERHPLQHANVMVEVEVTLTQTPVTKLVYRDEKLSKNVIEAGMFPVNGQGISGDIMLVSGTNGITVSFRPGQPS